MRKETRDVWASILFILYCTAVGTYLVFHPWAPAVGDASPYLRGFISGLGIVHLAAAALDLRSFFTRFAAPGGQGR
jgi:hypothetical protein